MVSFINEDMLRAKAPSIFAEKADERVSDRYQFIPTTRILSILQDSGWKPWDAKQVRTRVADANTTKHIVRLRHQDLTFTPDKHEGDVFPEMLVINSHEGRQSFQLRAGVFRMICSNGMVVSEEDFGKLFTRHIGFQDEDIYGASKVFCSNASKLNDTIESWRNASLTPTLRQSFYSEAAKLRFDEPSSEIVSGMSRTHRAADIGHNLWSSYNVAQENLIRGGIMNTDTRRRSKAIKSIQKDLELNTKLWDLGTKYYSMATA